jgi:diamine N-acetyltransferase
VSDTLLTLEPVSQSNVREICSLRVAPHQERLVSTNAESLAEAYVVAEAVPRGVRVDDVLVGFVMLYDSPGEPSLDLWRLMIDADYQGRGFGRQTVLAVVDYARHRPRTRVLTVGAEHGEGGPAPFYERLGFRRTGELRHGTEIRYELLISEPHS